MSHQGKTIKCKAAVAWNPKQPLEICEIDVAPPKQGEIRVKVISNALCHTDIYTLDGLDPEGLFPCILGHEATAIVESIGEGVTSVQIGDTIIPCYTPECREKSCVFCQSNKTNLCPKIRATQGKGFMPDGTSRFSKDGKMIYHFMGCSTFSEYTVIAEISAAKINPEANLNQMCLLGCGVSTGWGAAMNSSKVTPGSSVAVWGLGAVGLAVVQAAKLQGAAKIFGIDINEEKFEVAKQFGVTETINPLKTNAKDFLLSQEKWGIEFTFDCTGNVEVMRTALESAHRGFGESCVIGVAASGKEISTRPFQLVTGRHWLGTAFGGWKSRSDVPKLVNKVLLGEMPIEKFITHTFEKLEDVNQSIDVLHNGSCLRAVIKISECPNVEKSTIKVISNQKHFGGSLKTVKHWSKVNNCEMTFSIYLPDDEVSQQRGKPFPVLYFLSGLTSNHENAPSKSGFGQYAAQHKIAMVFPDTSPRGIDIAGIKDSWSFGDSAGYYVDATELNYINKELPELVQKYFHVSSTKQSITGHSMGGHGALISALRQPGKFQSVSAFAPICNPLNCPWGHEGFNGFFGSVEAGKNWDAVELMKNYCGPEVPILIDQGTNDKFFQTQLHLKNFENVCDNRKYPVRVNYQAGYDHSYFFISSFIGQHIEWHAKVLNSIFD